MSIKIFTQRGLKRGILSLGLLAVLASGSPSSSSVVNRISLKGVPYVAQLPNFCGPAALSSVLSYWGKPVSQTVIGSRVYDKKQGATNAADLLMFAREQGFSAYTCLSTMKELKEHLQAGIPILVLQNMSLSDKRGHFRVVIGYSDLTRMIFVRDSNYEEVRSIPYEEFDKTWSAFSRWALVVCPKEKDEFLSQSVRDNPVLHLDLGQAYLRLKQREQARAQFEAALRMEPGNEEAKDMLAQLESRGRRSS